MNENFLETPDQAELPVWARDDAFPKAPPGFGWLDSKLSPHHCDSLIEISDLIRNHSGNGSIQLVWSPNSKFCQLPEEIASLEEAILENKKRFAEIDLASSKNRLILFTTGLISFLAYAIYQQFDQLNQLQKASGIQLEPMEQATWLFTQLMRSTSVGFTLLIYLIFGFIPWYQARKSKQEIHQLGSDFTSLLPALRFETWLSLQKAPIAKLILISIFIVFFFQVVRDQSVLSFRDSISQAGLVKAAYFNGEFTRLLTAPFLHGGLLHFVMNALALLYLGKRMELFARWAHLPIVFLFSAIMGGMASAYLVPATSVGASGGLMGWLGFLLVFETLHHRLVPKSARRRLLVGVFMTALIGLIGYRFIDNAAHLGGLFAGMTYAIIVFPKSNSPLVPKINVNDRIVGSFCLAIIVLSCLLAVLKILT